MSSAEDLSDWTSQNQRSSRSVIRPESILFSSCDEEGLSEDEPESCKPSEGSSTNVIYVEDVTDGSKVTVSDSKPSTVCTRKRSNDSSTLRFQSNTKVFKASEAVEDSFDNFSQIKNKVSLKNNSPKKRRIPPEERPAKSKSRDGRVPGSRPTTEEVNNNPSRYSESIFKVFIQPQEKMVKRKIVPVERTVQTPASQPWPATARLNKTSSRKLIGPSGKIERPQEPDKRERRLRDDSLGPRATTVTRELTPPREQPVPPPVKVPQEGMACGFGLTDPFSDTTCSVKSNTTVDNHEENPVTTSHEILPKNNESKDKSISSKRSVHWEEEVTMFQSASSNEISENCEKELTTITLDEPCHKASEETNNKECIDWPIPLRRNLSEPLLNVISNPTKASPKSLEVVKPILSERKREFPQTTKPCDGNVMPKQNVKGELESNIDPIKNTRTCENENEKSIPPILNNEMVNELKKSQLMRKKSPVTKITDQTKSVPRFNKTTTASLNRIISNPGKKVERDLRYGNSMSDAEMKYKNLCLEQGENKNVPRPRTAPSNQYDLGSIFQCGENKFQSESECHYEEVRVSGDRNGSRPASQTARDWRRRSTLRRNILTPTSNQKPKTVKSTSKTTSKDPENSKTGSLRDCILAIEKLKEFGTQSPNSKPEYLQILKDIQCNIVSIHDKMCISNTGEKRIKDTKASDSKKPTRRSNVTRKRSIQMVNCSSNTTSVKNTDNEVLNRKAVSYEGDKRELSNPILNSPNRKSKILKGWASTEKAITERKEKFLTDIRRNRRSPFEKPSKENIPKTKIDVAEPHKKMESKVKPCNNEHIDRKIKSPKSKIKQFNELQQQNEHSPKNEEIERRVTNQIEIKAQVVVSGIENNKINDDKVPDEQKPKEQHLPVTPVEVADNVLSPSELPVEKQISLKESDHECKEAADLSNTNDTEEVTTTEQKAGSEEAALSPQTNESDAKKNELVDEPLTKAPENKDSKEQEYLSCPSDSSSEPSNSHVINSTKGDSCLSSVENVGKAATGTLLRPPSRKPFFDRDSVEYSSDSAENSESDVRVALQPPVSLQNVSTTMNVEEAQIPDVADVKRPPLPRMYSTLKESHSNDTNKTLEVKEQIKSAIRDLNSTEEEDTNTAISTKLIAPGNNNEVEARASVTITTRAERKKDTNSKEIKKTPIDLYKKGINLPCAKVSGGSLPSSPSRARKDLNSFQSREGRPESSCSRLSTRGASSPFNELLVKKQNSRTSSPDSSATSWLKDIKPVKLRTHDVEKGGKAAAITPLGTLPSGRVRRAALMERLPNYVPPWERVSCQGQDAKPETPDPSPPEEKCLEKEKVTTRSQTPNSKLRLQKPSSNSSSSIPVKKKPLPKVTAQRQKDVSEGSISRRDTSSYETAPSTTQLTSQGDPKEEGRMVSKKAPPQPEPSGSEGESTHKAVGSAVTIRSTGSNSSVKTLINVTITTSWSKTSIETW